MQEAKVPYSAPVVFGISGYDALPTVPEFKAILDEQGADSWFRVADVDNQVERYYLISRDQVSQYWLYAEPLNGAYFELVGQTRLHRS